MNKILIFICIVITSLIAGQKSSIDINKICAELKSEVRNENTGYTTFPTETPATNVTMLPMSKEQLMSDPALLQELEIEKKLVENLQEGELVEIFYAQELKIMYPELKIYPLYDETGQRWVQYIAIINGIPYSLDLPEDYPNRKIHAQERYERQRDWMTGISNEMP